MLLIKLEILTLCTIPEYFSQCENDAKLNAAIFSTLPEHFFRTYARAKYTLCNLILNILIFLILFIKIIKL